MKRRWLLLGGAALGGCSLLPQQPYLQRRDWPLDVQRAQVLPPRPRGPVLLVRSIRAAPGLEVRGLQWLLRDGSVHVDYYEQWAVPPAQAVEDDLRRWLANAGLFSAVTGAWQPVECRSGAGGRARCIRSRHERRRCACLPGAGATGSTKARDKGAVAEDREGRGKTNGHRSACDRRRVEGGTG